MDDLKKFHNLVDFLHKQKDDSPFSAEAWEEQDREIVRLTNAVKHIKNVCQSRAITNQDIIDMCELALYGIDLDTGIIYPRYSKND